MSGCFYVVAAKHFWKDPANLMALYLFKSFFQVNFFWRILGSDLLLVHDNVGR